MNNEDQYITLHEGLHWKCVQCETDYIVGGLATHPFNYPFWTPPTSNEGYAFPSSVDEMAFCLPCYFLKDKDTSKVLTYDAFTTTGVVAPDYLSPPRNCLRDIAYGPDGTPLTDHELLSILNRMREEFLKTHADIVASTLAITAEKEEEERYLEIEKEMLRGK